MLEFFQNRNDTDSSGYTSVEDRQRLLIDFLKYGLAPTICFALMLMMLIGYYCCTRDLNKSYKPIRDNSFKL